MAKVIYDQRLLKPGTKVAVLAPSNEPTTDDMHDIRVQIVFIEDGLRQALKRNPNSDVKAWVNDSLLRVVELQEQVGDLIDDYEALKAKYEKF